MNYLGFIFDLADQDSLSLRLFWGIGFFGLILIILQAMFGGGTAVTAGKAEAGNAVGRSSWTHESHTTHKFDGIA